MKLLLITTIKEFEKNVKDLLVHSGVSVFSYTTVKGYKAEGKEASADNWFASDVTESKSLMFMAFVADEKMDEVCGKVKNFNAKQEFQSKVHVVTLNIEKSI